MTSDITSPSKWRLVRLQGPWPVVALLGCYLALGLSAASRKTITGDEGTHLLGGYSYWMLNDYRLNPESGNVIQRWCALPVWLAGYDFPLFRDPQWQQKTEYELATRFLFESGYDPDRILMLARIMTSLLGAGLGLIVYVWSRRLFGPMGALISLTCYAFSPTMLTHGFLVLADLGLTFFLFCSVATVWMLLHRVSFVSLALCCLALSGLFLSKVSAAMMLPMALLLVVVRLLNPAPLIVALPRAREIKGAASKLAVIAGATLAVALGVWIFIWAAYGFRYSMVNPSVTKDSPPVELFPEPGVIANMGKFAAQHHLLPEAFLYSYAYMLSRTQGSNAFFNGSFSTRGWPGFFPYNMAVKTPLEFLIVLLLAGAAGWRFRGRTLRPIEATSRDSPQRSALYTMAPLLVMFAVYWAFALTSHFNIGHRHVLATYPLMFIFAGAAGRWFEMPAGQPASGARGSKPKSAQLAGAVDPSWLATIRAAIVVALLVSVVETLAYWPHYLAYFNFLDGGPRNAYKHLVDSSLDWSQDVKELKRWFDAHPADVLPPHRVYVSFFGSTPLEYYGIRAIKLPSFASPWTPHVGEPLRSGTYCISATELQNVLLLPCAGRWNKNYEEVYQATRRNVENYLKAQSDPELKARAEKFASQQEWNDMFDLYERLRFARLCSFLRPREPDDQVGYSINIYRLSDADIARALDGPPIELLETPEGMR